MKNTLLAALLSGFLLFMLSACGGGQSADAGSDGSTEGSGGANPDTLRVALLPDENANTVIQNNQPLKSYLEDELDKDIELVVTTDYSSMIEAMKRGRLELGYFGPLSYVLASQEAEIEPFAALIDEGEDEPVYYSILIGNAAEGVDEFSDAEGENVAYGDPASTSSHLIPKGILLDAAGMEAGQDYQEQFTGSHDAVALAVQNGNAAIGGMSKPIYEALVEKGTIDGEQVKVLEQSEPYPNYPWTMQANLDSDLKEQIRSTFLDMEDREVLDPFEADGFASVEDSDYDKVRELADKVGLAPEELAQ